MAEIEVRGPTKASGAVTAARDVSFTAAAGKVTTLRAAPGLNRRDVS
jgi:hypothetical protein